MAQNAQNVQMGVCSVTLGGTDLGHTKGGVEVSYEQSHKDIAVDAYGTSPVRKVLTGEKFKVKVPMAEYTILNLNKAMAQSLLTGAGQARLTVGQKSGVDSTSIAAQLVLHPTAAGASRAYDVVLYKAYPISTVTLHHSVDAEKIISVEFEALIDETKTAGNYLGLIGDSAA